MNKKVKSFICVLVTFITVLIVPSGIEAVGVELDYPSVGPDNSLDCDYNYLENEIIDFFQSDDLIDIERRLDTPNDDLRIVRFLLTDGTEEMRIFNEAVKYVDDDGQVHTKSMKLFENLEPGKFKYSNKFNDISMRFGKSLSDGIALSYKAFEIEIYPAEVAETIAQISYDGRSVYYDAAFSEQSRVEYVAEYSGLKEKIILNEYEGINSFSFVISTKLSLKLVDGIVRAYDENDKCIGSFGSVFVTDTNQSETNGFIDLEEIKGEGYLFRLTVPAEYLESAETVYPVTIDPSFYFNQYVYNFAGYKQIYDVTLYASTNAYYPDDEILTVNGMPYAGYSKVLIKFPYIGSILKKIDSDDLIGVYYAYNGLTNSSSSVVIRPMEVNWNTGASSLTSSEYYALYNGSMSSVNVYDTIHYGPGVLNITSIAKDWVDSVYPNRGIMIESLNTSGYNSIPSAEYSINTFSRPYIQVKYHHHEDVTDSSLFKGLFKLRPIDSSDLMSSYAMKNYNSVVTTSITSNVYNNDQLLYISWTFQGYTIQNPYNNYYLSSIVASDPEDCLLYYSPTCTSGSYWSFVEDSSGLYFLVGTSQEQLYCAAPTTVNSSITIINIPEGIATNQANKWMPVRQIDKIPFKIKNVSSHKYLTVENAYDKNGQNLFQRPLYGAGVTNNYCPTFGSQGIRVCYDSVNSCYKLYPIASKNGRFRTVVWNSAGNALQHEPTTDNNKLSISFNTKGQATIRQKTGSKLALQVYDDSDGTEGSGGTFLNSPGNIFFASYNSSDTKQKWIFEFDVEQFQKEAYYSSATVSYPLPNSGGTPDTSKQINSDFGARSITGNNLPHDGIDLFAHLGTTVYSTIYGTVVEVRKTIDPNAQDSRGLYVLIQSNSINKFGTNDKICMFVQHLNYVNSSINVGTTVTPSTVIGQVGYSGLSGDSNTHLHYGYCLKSDFDNDNISSNHYERCNFVDPLMFHNNTLFYETISSPQYYLIQID